MRPWQGFYLRESEVIPWFCHSRTYLFSKCTLPCLLLLSGYRCKSQGEKQMVGSNFFSQATCWLVSEYPSRLPSSDPCPVVWEKVTLACQTCPFCKELVINTSLGMGYQLVQYSKTSQYNFCIHIVILIRFMKFCVSGIQAEQV